MINIITVKSTIEKWLQKIILSTFLTKMYK